MAVTGLQERASIVQREMSQTVARMRPERARTLATFEEGRAKDARLAGLQIGYWKNHAHGQSWLSPTTGSTSFKRSTKQTTGAMYVGPVFRGMDIYLEQTVLSDMKKGYIPDSYIKERQRRIDTHMMKKNWASIGDATGAIAAVSSASGSTITCLADNSARGTSKGVFRLKVTDSTDPLLYDAVDPATDTVKATFYVTAKPSTTTATATFTFGNAAAMSANTYKICESGSWKMEMNGLAGLISDSTSRIFQGADVSVDEFLQNPSVTASAAVTPTMVHTAKSIMITRANKSAADGFDFGYVAHCTPSNFRDLAKFGYTTRQYQINDKMSSKKSFGLPTGYEDGDTIWMDDADYEDCYIDFRERAQYFEYVHTKFQLNDTDGISRFQWSGSYGAGSTNAYENYIEGVNLAWDGKGKDGDAEGGGDPATAVSIKTITLNTTSAQYVVGV